MVAPPDAAAAMAVLRQVRPPHRILTILEGESLLNDATALLIYRLAVGAAPPTFSVGAVAPAFSLAVAGSLVVGPALAWVILRVTRHVEDVPSAIIVQFVRTFGVWMLAEQPRSVSGAHDGVLRDYRRADARRSAHRRAFACRPTRSGKPSSSC